MNKPCWPALSLNCAPPSGRSDAFTVGALLETLTTDADGQASTEGSYAPGHYFLVETTAPAGFLLLTDPVQVVMGVGSGEAGIFTVRVYNDFDNNPALSIIKEAPTSPAAARLSDLAALYVGETVRYFITITNNGNTIMSDVVLTDDMAVVGSTVHNVNTNTDLTWAAGTDGIATLNLGDLAAGETIDLTYDYVTVESDLAREPITNTAIVIGQLAETPDYPNGATVSSRDTAVDRRSTTPRSAFPAWPSPNWSRT